MSDAAARGGPAAPADVVELRVHGASRASAGEVLDLSPTEQVAGDRSGGFYRPGRRPVGAGDAGRVTLEAYRWGDLPAGTMARALWLVFLLPFMLVNVAIWMRPANRGSDEVVRSLCRLLALTLTALYVLAVAGVALDLVAWKCMASPDCLAGRGWLSWLGGRPVGLRLAVLALVPAGAVGLLWRASTRPGRVFEAFRAPEAEVSGHRLGALGRWDADPLVGRLRSVHVAAAFGTLDATLLAARAAPGASAGTVALAAVTGTVLAACVVLLCTPPLIDRSATDRRLDRITGTLRTTALVLTALVAAHVLAGPASWHAVGGLPGYGTIVTWLFVAQTALLAVLGAVLLRRRGRRAGAPPLFGLGALATTAVAISLGVAYSAELVYRVADFLDRDAPTAVRATAAGPPAAYAWAIVGFFRTVSITVVVGGLVALISRRSRLRAAAAVVARDHPDPPPEAGPRLRQVLKAIARARFTEKLIPLAVVYACLAGVGTATTTINQLELWPVDVVERLPGLPANLVLFASVFGSWVVAAVVVGLVLGAIFAYRTVGFRRHIGILWDLGTFWPRAAHPFAPPCYAERAVPELTRRITYLVERGNGVLLTGHSHGSVLAAATVLQLPPRVSGRVALLTYGSPLRRLYARLFPAYVDEEALHEIGARVGWRWLNLWRETDPVGGWIFSADPPATPDPVTDPAAAVDRRLRDPAALVAPPGDSVPPPIKGHRPCESDQPFTEASRELIERLREPPAPGPR